MKYSINVVRSIFLLLSFASSISKTDGQQNGNYPVSVKIFSPFIFNPAITGSKDFLSVDIVGSSQKNFNSQVITENSRLSIKKTPRYFSSVDDKEFLNIGVGGSIFTVFDGSSRNTGISGSIAYHIPLGKTSFSYISFGTSFKAIYCEYFGNKDLSIPSQNTFQPNADFGLYYYSPTIFAGLSATDLLGKYDNPDSLYSIPVTRQYHFLTGYKLVLSHSHNIVLEPSIIIGTDDSLSFDEKKNFKPILKVYLGKFCIGTYFNDYDKNSVFFQFRYPRFCLGAFFEIPKNSPFYKKPMTAEFALGIIFPRNKSGIKTNNHW